MSEVLAHSKYSASGFEAMTLCPGKRVLERGKPNNTSKYSAEGTAAHNVLNWALERAMPASEFLGGLQKIDGFEIRCTEEMVQAVQTAINNIAEIVGDGMLLSEVKVNYSSYLGVDAADGWGTSDVVAYLKRELQVHDYKHGMGVIVDADDNPQMKLYALGALIVLRDMGEDPETVRLVIHQPRIKSAPSEWTCTVAELEAWGRTTARSSVCTQINAEKLAEHGVDAQAEWEATFLRPNDKSCKFCKAKATCPAARAQLVETVSTSRPATPDDFVAAQVVTVGKATPIEWLTAILTKADQIEELIAAARAEVFRRLDTGEPVKGFKLVTGKRGNRAWSDAAAAEAQLKAMRLKVEEMYDLKLISPTSAEKLTEGEKPLIGPRQWVKVKALITQADGKPSVAPESDKRPAIVKKATAAEFEAIQSTTPATQESEYA